MSLCGRSIQESKNGSGKHFYMKNRRGLYPSYPVPDTKKLILTEVVAGSYRYMKPKSRN